MQFWDYETFCFYKQKSFFFSPEHYEPFLLLLFLAKINNEKKIAFFDQKHGLTPLEKCHF